MGVSSGFLLPAGLSDVSDKGQRIGPTVKPPCTSLRAERSNPSWPRKGRMDCFASLAMTALYLQMHVGDLAARCARVCHFSFAQKTEGVGNAGAPLHPQPCVRSVESTRVFTTVAPEHPAFPHAMVLTVYVVLSPVTGLSCHRRQRIVGFSAPGRADLPSANLTPASGRQDHTTSPSAATSLVSTLRDRSQVFRLAPQPHRAQNAAASTASHTASMTIAIRPSSGTRRCRI